MTTRPESNLPAQAVLGSRELFPDLEASVYLNHASLSPPSLPVIRAVQRSLTGYATQGMPWYSEEMACRDRLRAQLAGLIGGEAEDLGLIANTSAGVLAIALCLDWSPGDRIVLFEGEFPTNITPWQQTARRENLDIIWHRADDFRLNRDQALERLEDTLKRGIRLVAVSAVQFTTGQRMPLEAIGALCARHGAELFVDGIQALGVVPIDAPAMGISFFTAGSHKWLMGPEGLGCLWVDPTASDRLLPNVAGWLSHEEAFAFLTNGPGHLRYDRPFQHGARMVESGTFNSFGAAGLKASVELIEQIGVQALFNHVQAWHDAIEPGLIERGFESARMASAEGRSGSLSLRPPPGFDAPAWARAMAAHGISASSPDGWLRLAPSWPNALNEVQIVLDAVDVLIDDASAFDQA
ncbi:MAG: aminotransferase class V-fold PLP-dependent enzyme [Pseudomonadota bacterium]